MGILFSNSGASAGFKHKNSHLVRFRQLFAKHLSIRFGGNRRFIGPIDGKKVE